MVSEDADRSPRRAARSADALIIASLAILALLVLHGRLGLSVVDPTDIAWMQQGDWPNYLLGWSFYRFDDWRFPLGYFNSLLHPVGTSTGLTDSIPWLALIGRLFDSLLPASFQYFGAYLLLCFFLQGLLGFRIMMLLCGDRLHSLLSAAFLMAAPVLLDRVIHISLCSQWMILAMILWTLSRARSPRAALLCRRKATALNLLAAVTHPYLWVMTFALSLPLFLPSRRAASGPSGAASTFLSWSLLQILAAGLGWWVFGYLALGSTADSGFGDYGGGFLGFFNSAGKTALLPPIRMHVQSESFDFIGLGITLIAAIFVAVTTKRWIESRGSVRAMSGPWLPRSPFFALMMVATALWLFSLARLAFLFRWLGPLPDAFRCSGRFAWPLYYCLILFLLWRYRRAFPSRAASAFLLLLLALQVYDLKPFWTEAPARRPIPQVGTDPFWREASQRFAHLVLWPGGNGDQCSGLPIGGERIRAFLFLAARERMTINVGVTSRPPNDSIRAACREMRAELAENRPEPATLYIVRPEDVSAGGTFGGLPCRTVDRLQVCGAGVL